MNRCSVSAIRVSTSATGSEAERFHSLVLIPKTTVSDSINADDTVGTVSEETVDQDRGIWTELRFVNRVAIS
jgi:hypothetical protein